MDTGKAENAGKVEDFKQRQIHQTGGPSHKMVQLFFHPYLLFPLFPIFPCSGMSLLRIINPSATPICGSS
jgi:hypothetical protein